MRNQENVSSGRIEVQPHLVQTALSHSQEPHLHLHLGQKPLPDLSIVGILEIITSFMPEIRYPVQLNFSCCSRSRSDDRSAPNYRTIIMLNNLRSYYISHAGPAGNRNPPAHFCIYSIRAVSPAASRGLDVLNREHKRQCRVLIRPSASSSR